MMGDHEEQSGDLSEPSGDAANISVENQPVGSARHPRDTLDRKSKRDPDSGGTIPDDYDPATMTREDEENETRAGREGRGKR